MGHTWEPSCSRAALDIFSKTLVTGLKINLPFYLVQDLFRKRKLVADDVVHIAKNTLWSSLFVSAHFSGMPALACFMRNVFGRVYIVPNLAIPLLVGFPALFLERSSRRKTLALYTMELAADTLLRMLESREVITSYRHSDVVAFAIAMSVFLYSIRIRIKTRDSTYHFLRYLLCSDGKKKKQVEEEGLKSCDTPEEPVEQDIANNNKDQPDSLQRRLQEQYKTLTMLLKILPRHESCPHRFSCLYNAIKDAPFLFLVGWLGAGGALELLTRPLFFMRNPFRSLLSLRPLGSGLFLAAYSLLYKASNCGLRWTLGRDEDWFSVPAAFLCSPLVKLAPIDSMPFYLAMKGLEFLFDLARGADLVPEVPYGSHWVYGLSSCLVSYALTIEPQNVKHSFYKLVDYYTYPMLRHLNRHTMVKMGANTGMHGGKYPDLDPKYITPTYVEHILLWNI